MLNTDGLSELAVVMNALDRMEHTERGIEIPNVTCEEMNAIGAFIRAGIAADDLLKANGIDTETNRDTPD